MEEHDGLHDGEEVLKDLKTSLEKIDFEGGYNPESKEFGQALNLGLMWLVLRKMAKAEGNVPEAKADDEIAETLHLSKVFLQKFIDTSDSSFREMAENMVRYAGMLLKKANARLPSGDEKKRLKAYESELGEISGQLAATS